MDKQAFYEELAEALSDLPACVRIAMGRGVCGTAVQRAQTIVVPDVHQFPGHIACDAASNAEVVVPIVQGGRVVGVLDIDSPVLGRFDAADGAGLERIVAIFCQSTDLSALTTSGAFNAFVNQPKLPSRSSIHCLRCANPSPHRNARHTLRMPLARIFAGKNIRKW